MKTGKKRKKRSENVMYKYGGYCLNFEVDKMGDKFVPGSCSFTVPLPLLLEHKEIIGEVLFYREDKFGVYIEFLSNIYFSESSYFLSVGFKTIKEENIFYRHLKKVNIKEVSVVKNPAQTGTNIKLIKRKI